MVLLSSEKMMRNSLESLNKQAHQQTDGVLNSFLTNNKSSTSIAVNKPQASGLTLPKQDSIISQPTVNYTKSKSNFSHRTFNLGHFHQVSENFNKSEISSNDFNLTVSKNTEYNPSFNSKIVGGTRVPSIVGAIRIDEPTDVF